MQPQEEQINPTPDMTQDNEPSDSRAKKRAYIKKEIVSWILTLGAAVVIALLVNHLLFQPIWVDGESMCDTLQNGEIMIATKPEYLLGDPARGDVIICKYPGREENFVKRVMGVPGDVIEVRYNVVYRNGEALDEPYLTPERNDNGFSMDPFTLGDKEYFVMGDNRDNSHDSRNYYGYNAPSAITRDMVVGHVRWVVFPFNAIRGIE